MQRAQHTDALRNAHTTRHHADGELATQAAGAANAIDVSRPPTLPQPQTLWTTRLLPPRRGQCALCQRLMLLRRCFEQRRLARGCSRSRPAWLRSSQAEVRRRVPLHSWLANPSGSIDPDGLVSRNSPLWVKRPNQAAAAQAAAAWQIALASSVAAGAASVHPQSRDLAVLPAAMRLSSDVVRTDPSQIGWRATSASTAIAMCGTLPDWRARRPAVAVQR